MKNSSDVFVIQGFTVLKTHRLKMSVNQSNFYSRIFSLNISLSVLETYCFSVYNLYSSAYTENFKLEQIIQYKLQTICGITDQIYCAEERLCTIWQSLRLVAVWMSLPPSPAVYCLTENKYKFRYYN